MAEPIDGRPLAAQVYAIGLILRRSAIESYRNSLDLGATEWPIVATLWSGPASLAKVCERLSRDKGQVSREIAELVGRGVLVKTRDRNDSRQIVIDIDRSNGALMDEVQRITEERDRILCAGFSASEKRDFLRLLSKLYENACNPQIFDV